MAGCARQVCARVLRGTAGQGARASGEGVWRSMMYHPPLSDALPPRADVYAAHRALALGRVLQALRRARGPTCGAVHAARPAAALGRWKRPRVVRGLGDISIARAATRSACRGHPPSTKSRLLCVDVNARNARRRYASGTTPQLGRGDGFVCIFGLLSPPQISSPPPPRSYGLTESPRAPYGRRPGRMCADCVTPKPSWQGGASARAAGVCGLAGVVRRAIGCTTYTHPPPRPPHAHTDPVRPPSTRYSRAG